MGEQREMTLDEWVNRLPEFHLANKQYQQLQQQIAELEQFYSEAIKLLDAAVCPCCDKSGAYYDNNGEVCQCQWCDEVSILPQPQKGEKQ